MIFFWIAVLIIVCGGTALAVYHAMKLVPAEPEGLNSSPASIVIPIAADEKNIPTKAHATDAAYDLRSTENRVVKPGEREIVDTGVKLHLPDGYGGLVLPRSGLAAKHGITVVNSPGLLDPSYIGMVRIILLNTGDKDFLVEEGDRIAQLMVVPSVNIDFKIVAENELEKTERSTGGFGSSGIK